MFIYTPRYSTQPLFMKQETFMDTPLKFNLAPEKSWLEDEFPSGMAYFQGLC